MKIGGHRVELGEIENVLLAHAQISQATVVVRENQAAEKRLTAYVVAPAAVASGIRSYAAAQLPDYMVPAHFVCLAALPLTRNGKIDHASLPEPDAFNQGWNDLFVPPATAIQRELAAIWREIFGLKRVGIADSFFDLGGDSLTAARLVSRIWNRFAVEIGIDDVFELPTIVALAAKIETKAPTLRPAGDSSAESPAPLAEVHPSAASLPFAQRRLWFLAQFEDTGTAYHISSVLRLEGELDHRALERSFSDVIRRQEALRTVFPSEDGKAVARVLEPVAYRLPFTDLSGFPEKDIQEAAKRQTEQRFDLAAGPLFRAAVFRLSAAEHLLAVSMHHIVSDGWSMNVLIREVSALYEAHRTCSAIQLPELPMPYSKYADWQDRRLEGERGQRQLEYWKRQLAGAPELLELPIDRPRPPIQSYRGGLNRIPVPARVAARLRSLAQESGASLFMVLLSAYAVFLSRYSRQSEVTVGVPVANRNAQELEPLIGLFVNTLALRIGLEECPSFRELLKCVKAVVLAAFENQETPFEQIVAALDVKRDTSHSPLFQVMFAYENVTRTPLSATGLRFVPFEVESTTAKFDLTLYMEESGADLIAAFEYNSDLFDAATICRMSGQFAALLEAVASDTGRPLRAVSMFAAEERELLAAWNRTGAEYDLRPIQYLFEDQVGRTPETIAVEFGDRQLTYAALNDRANRLAHHLRSVGVTRDVPVGIAMERSLEMIVGLLAILKAGGAYVPIDPEYPAERVLHIIEDCRAPVTLTQVRLLQTLPELGGQVVCVDRDWEEIALSSGVN
ncbi:MAG: condensation domain-containing protein, partial [Bryobacteraceae bacterium]